MKAVILAAGVGSRLGRPYPKSLSLLPSGERILGRQIRIFRESGIKEIIVVVGFKMGLIMEEYPSVFYKYNPTFYISNTSKSLLAALQDLDDDVIWINGDVVFDPQVIEELLRAEPNAVAVDRKKCSDEEVKYRTDFKGRILEISKQVFMPEGEAVGVNKVGRLDLKAFTKSLDECEDNDYFEKGLELLVKQGLFFKAVDISEYRCIEVDFETDYQEAQKMFAVYNGQNINAVPVKQRKNYLPLACNSIAL